LSFTTLKLANLWSNNVTKSMASIPQSRRYHLISYPQSQISPAVLSITQGVHSQMASEFSARWTTGNMTGPWISICTSLPQKITLHVHFNSNYVTSSNHFIFYRHCCN
jgi:hypothetical protein